MSHQVESGFFVSVPAWHGLGTVLDAPPTTAEAITAAGLDWTVEQQPIYRSFEDRFQPIDTHKSLVRSTDQKLLGVVSQHYQPLQNQDAFKWFDFLLHENNVTLEAAGSLKEGKRIWVLAKIEEATVDVDKDDPVNPYLLLSNSHDGTMAIWIQFTPIRVVCYNTLSWALSSRERAVEIGRAFRIYHRGKIDSKLESARNALDFARQKFQDTTVEYQAMANKSLTTELFELYLSKVLQTDTPTSTRAYPQILSNFEQGRGNKGQNLWHGYNAVTESILLV